jgi:hypothetical protein
MPGRINFDNSNKFILLIKDIKPIPFIRNQNFSNLFQIRIYRPKPSINLSPNPLLLHYVLLSLYIDFMKINI